MAWRHIDVIQPARRSDKTRAIFYFFLFLTALPLFYLFIVNWYAPELRLGDIFIILTTIGVIGQFIAVIIPAVPGRKEMIHNIAAYTMGATFIPLTLLVAFADVTLFATIIAFVASIFMIGSCVLYLTAKKLHPYYLYFQASYIAAFHIAILVSAYL